MGPRALVQALVTVAVVASGMGCRFDAPSYEGTSYACEPPRLSCPPGFTCVDGRCTTGSGVVDAAAVNTETLRVEVAYDASIRSDAPTTNDGSNDFLDIDASPRRVTLVFFDLSTIAAGRVVTGAELGAVVFDPLETGTFQLYPLTESWAEGAATWDQREAGVPWSAPGLGVPTLDASALLGEVAPRAPGPIMVTLDVPRLQGWISTPSSNHGLAVVSTSPDGRGGQLRSREYMTAADRPFLLVTLLAP